MNIRGNGYDHRIPSRMDNPDINTLVYVRYHYSYDALPLVSMAHHIITTGMVGTPMAIPVIPDGKEYEMTHKRPWRHNDQMYCAECCKSWDIDDPEPPSCEQRGQRSETNHQRGKRWIKRLKEQLK